MIREYKGGPPRSRYRGGPPSLKCRQVNFVTGKRLLLFLGAFLLSVGVSYGIVLARRGGPVAPADDPNLIEAQEAMPLLGVDTAGLEMLVARGDVKGYRSTGKLFYKRDEVSALAVKSKTTEPRQAFDRAIAYIGYMQETDGHWSAARHGASAEFSGINGDIAITAMCLSALLESNQGRNQNRDAIARAKTGMEWLSAHVKEDGRICDESGAGEPVMAQIFASFAFLQAIEQSSKTSMRETCEKVCRYAMLKLGAKPGGYGDKKDSPYARADITAMASVLFNQSRSTQSMYISFAEPRTDASGKNHAAALAIEEKIKAGMEALRCEPKKNGTFAHSSENLKPDWNSTVAGVLNQKVFGLEGPEYVAGLEYLFGVKYDAYRMTKSGTFPTLEKNMCWGAKGEGYEVLGLLEGWILFFNEYGPARAEWGTWTKMVMDLLLKNQSADGGWAAAGADARWGRLWRTAIQARIINMLSPAQLPPPAPQVPPPEEPPPEKEPQEKKE